LYAGFVGWCVDRSLSRATWTQHSPRAALWLWHATACGVLGAIAWAMILLAHDAAEHAFAELLGADKALLHAAYAVPREIPWYWNLTLVVLLTGLVKIVVAGLRGLLEMRRTTSFHQLATTHSRKVPAPDGSHEVVGVVDTAMSAVYCLGSRRTGSPQIQVTTGALELLDEQELQAAVAHERGHLKNHHHMVVLLVESLATSVAWTGLLRSYPAAVRQLVELEADDHAARRCGRVTVARALLAMGSSPSLDPGAPTAQSWTGWDPARRIRRLIDPGPQRRGVTCLASVLGSTMLVLTPLAASLAPALSLSGTSGAVSHHNEPLVGFDHH
jgi:Zn-dependent protease with chaperone function